eukprot:gene19396-biopygen31121
MEGPAVLSEEQRDAATNKWGKNTRHIKVPYQGMMQAHDSCYNNSTVRIAPTLPGARIAQCGAPPANP